MPAQGGAHLRALWCGVRGRAALERVMDEGFATHLALRAVALVLHGMARAEAERTVRPEFGMSEAVKRRAREARGLLGLDRTPVTWLDFRLGFRMLVRYPALTRVAGVAIAFGIAAGLTTSSFVGQALDPRLPLPEGDRVVGARLWDEATRGVEPLPFGDLQDRRRTMRLLHDVGTFRTTEQNLRTRGAAARALTWGQRRGAGGAAGSGALVRDVALATRGDSSASVTTVQLERERHVVVGVMPPGLAFPVAHDAWVPLRAGRMPQTRPRSIAFSGACRRSAG